MKKLLKSDICGFVNSARMHYSRLKSQHTVAANLLKCMQKKKKKKKRFENANVGLEMQIQTHTKERFGSTVMSHVRISKPTFAFSDFFFSQRVNCNITRIYCARDKKYYSRTVHTMFKGSTVLFTHLKIILLQCFQFSVSAKISYIQTDL